MSNCIVVELTDGSRRAYAYPDEQIAQQQYQECREEWNAGRNVVFYVRSRRGTIDDILPGDNVTHLELVTRDVADARGIHLQSAVIFG